MEFIKKNSLLISVIIITLFGMLMIYRQEKVILYQGDMTKTIDEDKYKDQAENDEFFTENYDRRFTQ